MLTDHHMHLLSPGCIKKLESKKNLKFDKYPPGDRSACAVLSQLEESGFVRANVISGAYIAGSRKHWGEAGAKWIRTENDYTAEQVQLFPKILKGFASLDPFQEGYMKEIIHFHEQGKLEGLKLHFGASGIDLKRQNDLKRIENIFRISREREMDLLIHFRNNSDGWGVVEAGILINSLIKSFRGLKIQMAHLGGYGGYDKTTNEVLMTFSAAAQDDPSVMEKLWFDLSGIFLDKKDEKEFYPARNPDEDLLREMTANIRNLGLDRFLFGSDWPAFTISRSKEMLLERLPLETSEKEVILNNGGLWI